MVLTVNGHPTYCYTGGKPFNPAQPTVIFIHGVLNDHSVWILQTRYLAHHGWNVLAVDLPGHCKSEGAPPQTVAEASRFIVALLDATGLAQAALVGHSLGSLIALQTAADAPQRVSQLVLVGTAFPMKVSPVLLDLSLHTPLKAIDLVNSLSHSMLAPPPSTLGPGSWLYGGARALMRRVLDSNLNVNLFHAGFKACDDYNTGEAAMESTQCATLFIVGSSDQMTPPKAAQSLISRAKQAKVCTLQAGHSLMSEAPDGVLHALLGFLKR